MEGEEIKLEYFIGAHGVPMITDNNGVVGEIHGHEDHNEEELKEFAKTLVLAYNSHDELVRAVEYLLTTIRRHAPHVIENQMETLFATAILKKIKPA